MHSSDGRMLMSALAWMTMLSCVVANPVVQADDKKDPPRIGMSVPLAMPKGTSTKIVLRGWKLDQVTEVRTGASGVTTKTANKGKAAVPNGQDAKLVGDSQVEVELTIPAELTDEEVVLVVVGPDGESRPYGVFVGGREPNVAEKEANDGFRQAQAIAIPQLVDGQIQSDRDVDVYSVTADAGRPLVVEVIARRRGSGLDGIVTIYDDKGRILATNDDNEGADPRIRFTVRHAGQHYIVLQDAHDHGGPAHPYRLIVRQTSE